MNPDQTDKHRSALIDLKNLVPFAQGGNRYCFQHPEDKQRCLKVIRPENIKARYLRQPGLKRLLGRARLNDNSQELKAHMQPAIRWLIRADNESTLWAHLPKFYGSVETNLGHANESELIRCADETVAPTLESLIRRGELTDQLQGAIKRFETWLIKTRILTRNLLPHNLVVTDRSGQPELFLVDGLGAPSIPQALAILPGWSDHYIRRKLARFHTRIMWEQSNEGYSWEDFQRLR